MLNVMEAVNTNFLSLLVWLDQEIEPRSTVFEVDALTTVYSYFIYVLTYAQELKHN